MTEWWCCNCEALRSLDTHGRCNVCESNSVDVAIRPAMTAEGLAVHLTVADLEELYRK